MAATLTLDWHQLLWYLQGGMSGSHLRWGIYEDFVNIVFPQLSYDEREAIYTYAKRDLDVWSKFGIKTDETAKEYFHRLLARFNPANQYIVECDNGVLSDERRAYLYEGKYYVGWNSFADEKWIKKITPVPYKKCRDKYCEAKDLCLRYTTFKDGDKVFDDSEIPCDKCDYIIKKED